MKISLFAILSSLTLAATPALAQPAAPAPAATPAPASKFNLDTPIEVLAADPAALAVLEANFPGTTKHAMYDSFKGMSLNELAPAAGGAITPEALAKTGKELAAIK